MKFSRIMSLALVIAFLLLFIPGCEEKYDYPDWFTGEYCKENYTVMSGNYVHSQAYGYSVDNNGERITYDGYGGRWYFYAIHGENIENYILGCNKTIFLSDSYTTRILTPKNNSIAPIRDWNIQRLEICAVKYFLTDREDALNYEEACTLTVFDKTVDPDVLRELSGCFSSHHSTMHVEDKESFLINYDNYSEAYNKHQSDKGNDYILKVVLRVRFEETPNIMWEAHIVQYDGDIYLICRECYDSHGGYWLISLNETVADYIESVLSANPEIYFE